MEKELGDFTTSMHGVYSMPESCGKTCSKRFMATIDLNQGFEFRVRSKISDFKNLKWPMLVKVADSLTVLFRSTTRVSASFL